MACLLPRRAARRRGVEIVPARPAVGAGLGRQRGNQWADGDGLPAIVPGVRIDLSKESYA